MVPPYSHPKRKASALNNDDFDDEIIEYKVLEQEKDDDRDKYDGWGFDPGYTNSAAFEQLQARVPEDQQSLLGQREECEKPAGTTSTPIKPGTTSTPIKRKLLSGHGLQHYPLSHTT